MTTKFKIFSVTKAINITANCRKKRKQKRFLHEKPKPSNKQTKIRMCARKIKMSGIIKKCQKIMANLVNLQSNIIINLVNFAQLKSSFDQLAKFFEPCSPKDEKFDWNLYY